MVIREYPEEIKKLMQIYEPFVKYCKLVDPTPEAVDAFEQVKKWSLEQGQ